jgi:hypothetical protein
MLENTVVGERSQNAMQSGCLHAQRLRDCLRGLRFITQYVGDAKFRGDVQAARCPVSGGELLDCLGRVL